MSDLASLMQRANAQNNLMPIGPVPTPPSLLGQIYQAYTQPSIFSPSNQQQVVPHPQTDSSKFIAVLSQLHPQPSGGAGKGGGSVTGAVSNVAKLLSL